MNMDIEQIATTIKADAGEPLADLCQALREVAEAKGRTTTAEQLLVRGARNKLGLSQSEYAARIGTPVATLRDLEQGRFPPPGAALCLLKLLISHPQLAQEIAA